MSKRTSLQAKASTAGVADCGTRPRQCSFGLLADDSAGAEDILELAHMAFGSAALAVIVKHILSAHLFKVQ